MRCVCTDALEEYHVQEDVVYCLVSPSLSSTHERTSSPCLLSRYVSTNLETPWSMTSKYLIHSWNLRLQSAVGITGCRRWCSVPFSSISSVFLAKTVSLLLDAQLSKIAVAAAPVPSCALLLFPGIMITRSSAYAICWVFGSSSSCLNWLPIARFQNFDPRTEPYGHPLLACLSTM